MSQPQAEEYLGIIPIKRCSGLPTDPLTLENTRVLLTTQKTDSHHLPFWYCPKSHSEQDENKLLDPALMELKKDTGVLVEKENIIPKPAVHRVGTTTVTYSIITVSADVADRLELEKDVKPADWLTFPEAVERSSKDTKNLLRRVMIDVLKVPVETLDVDIEDESFGLIPISIQYPAATSRSEKMRISTGNTKVLLIQQKTFDGYGRSTSHWSLPKGHPEMTDKSPIATAVRELTEETGLESSFVWEIPSYSMIYWTPFKRCWKKVTFWLGLVDERQEIRCEEREVGEARFMSWEEAMELMQVQGLLKRVVDRLDSGEVHFEDRNLISSSQLRADTGSCGSIKLDDPE